jgi:hypothetical protein
VRRLLSEPLLHFFALGAALFGLYGLAGEKQAAQRPTIVVSAAQIENLANGFARVWQRPPTALELQGLIEDYIRNEVYHREAKLLGLDRDDLVIQRRLRLKMEIMAENMATSEPSDAELEAYLASHSASFKSEDRFTFRHVFLSADRRTALNDDAGQVAAKLASANAEADIAEIGDRFLLGDAFGAMTRSEVSRTFGDGFAERLVALEPGHWQGPIASGYGLHFVFIDERTSGTTPPLDAVRQAVTRELISARRVEAQEKLYRALRDRYDVTVEARPITVPGNHTAVR